MWVCFVPINSHPNCPSFLLCLARIPFSLQQKMSFVCPGCGSVVASQSNAGRHRSACARYAEWEVMNTVFPDPDELMMVFDSAEITLPFSAPQPPPAPLPSPPKKMGRPLKRLCEQSPRTEQNKRARFEKDIRAVEEKHGRVVSSLKSQESHAALSSDISKFYNELPPRSPLRQSLLHGFTREKDPATMAEFFGVSRQTIEKAQALKDEDNTAVQLKYPLDVIREKIPEANITRIQEFWYENTIPVPWKTSTTYKGKKGNKEKASIFSSFSR